jgi:thioesterase domain-containing protein
VLSSDAARHLLAAMRRDLLQPVQLPGTRRPPARPYISRSAGDRPLMLDAGQPGLVAAMPPLFGYGAAFLGLAEKLKGAAFGLFDFIEAEDRIARYVRAIRQAADGRMLALVGYSGGGNLGFAVTKALEAAGTQVRTLILLDAPMKRRRVVQDHAAVQEMMSSNLAYFEARMAADANYAAYVNQPGLRAMMLHRMEAFIRHLNAHLDEGTIAADIDLIRSTQQWAEPDDWTGWVDRTQGRFTTHQGFGIHAHMTEGLALDGNAGIIGDILRRHGLGAPAAVLPEAQHTGGT